LVVALADYRCSLSLFVSPARVYACREFEVEARLSCYLESGAGPPYVEPAGVPLGWWLDGRYQGLTSTDAAGRSSRRFHIEEPGVHTVFVRFFGAFRDGNYYKPVDAEIKVLVEPTPAPPPEAPAPPRPPVDAAYCVAGLIMVALATSMRLRGRG
jgi:hypothetical protein